MLTKYLTKKIYYAIMFKNIYVDDLIIKLNKIVFKHFENAFHRSVSHLLKKIIYLTYFL